MRLVDRYCRLRICTSDCAQSADGDDSSSTRFALFSMMLSKQSQAGTYLLAQQG